ncbi:unnamed protein product [Parascedosporium putredinis]|uniref:VWFA domain-containing protein n=1 Tax=Parascedosporium putredinis TaxID=1442378 RepID=A0A9P1GYX3_9PEZI|nr:unnamed protein product [Parascedosporium putredinis]CAI7992252.1 unnamed protein product [Parascedosporium putredinis]
MRLRVDQTALSPPLEEATGVTLGIHSVPEHGGILVKVQPRGPAALPLTDDGKSLPLPRTPCDIVLVIDISGSMNSRAPIPGDGTEPDYGFSVLDLTKHAALTILETLDEADRLGIVFFSDNAQSRCQLEPMTEANKAICKKRILGARPREGPAMMVLTDGQPNMGCPSRGYVPKLLERGSDGVTPAIHTFGFGNHLRSGLLKSISDVGGGGYSFIPDSSMLGTVFVHTLANLQSTYSNRTSLRLRYPSSLTLKPGNGLVAAAPKPVKCTVDGQQLTELTIPLGNLQYGQSRDLFFQAAPAELVASGTQVEAVLTYSCMTDDKVSVSHRVDLGEPATGRLGPSPAEVAYHVSRSQICEFIGSHYKLNPDQEHAKRVAKAAPDGLQKLLEALPARKFSTGADGEDDADNGGNGNGLNDSLLHELDADRGGQIPLAVGPDYFQTWGEHYLLSLKSAHERQVCNSFKDPGPLQYSCDSPLFIQCRDILDDVFDNLKAPPPSLRTSYTGERDMRVYRNVAGPCFAGSTPVQRVLATPVGAQVVVRLGADVLVTPWHPVVLGRPGTAAWQFPAVVAGGQPVWYRGAVYSVLLERDEDVDAHAIAVGTGEVWGVTLGHGMTTGADVRAHGFLGNRQAVSAALDKLGEGRRGAGVVFGGGVVKDAEGLVCGFAPFRGVPGASRRVKMVGASAWRRVVV